MSRLSAFRPTEGEFEGRFKIELAVTQVELSSRIW